MRLPKDLLSQTYTKPRLFLCQTDKSRICQLETIEMSASFKFNTYSELTFSVGRTYINMNTGETQINPFYNQIEALRLVYLENFGYFEIQEPEIFSDGIQEIKNVTAYSLEYTLSQKYLENFNVNTGKVDSIEVLYAGNGTIIPVTLYNQSKPELSLLDLSLQKIYGWKIGHVDSSLESMSRQFEISRTSVYDFIVQDICEKFNCFAVFDTINNTINLYAEALISKYIGDGKTSTFVVTPPYKSIDTVTIDSYKTSEYIYNNVTGQLTFEEPPQNGARIEVTDGYQEKWMTDVYVGFDNLTQEVNISYSADDIKTVLTVKGADDLDIREVNMGLPYIIDISYYHSVDWMGQDLYDRYTEYLKINNTYQSTYADNAKKMIECYDYISYLTYRETLNYVLDKNVNHTTVGKYYVKGGSEQNPYYKEVKLPSEYNVNTEYYKLSDVNLNEDKFNKFYMALRAYFLSRDVKDVSELEKLVEDFMFVKSYTMSELINSLSTANTYDDKKNAIYNFLYFMLDELGLDPLQRYLKIYQEIKTTNEESGWNEDTSSDNYLMYYNVTLIVDSINNKIKVRQNSIDAYNDQYDSLQKENSAITKDSSLYEFFNDDQLARLSAFLREDEYTDDNFVITDSDTTNIIIQRKQELRECGRIELSKLCSPKLSFSMDMANIYALDEFAPIVGQFQLGNLINVVIRPDYIKRARLLEVNINFDDFSDFSCEFGELTNLKTPSSIHADLLASALTAGKSVASGQSYWNNGADLATSTDIKIQNGLLSAINGIYNGDKSVLIDNRGILLRQVLDSGEYSPYQIWLTNNNILVSTDSFQSAQAGIGVFEVDGRELYGVLAKAVLSGYVESSHIVGGTIRIGEQADGTYAFEVQEDGTVTMGGGSTIAGYAKEEDVAKQIQNVKNTSTIISETRPTDANDGQLWINTSTYPYTVMVFSKENKDDDGEWVYFSQQSGSGIYTSLPSSYVVDDLWIVSDGDIAKYSSQYPDFFSKFKSGSILRATVTSSTFNTGHWEDVIKDINATVKNVKETFTWNSNGIQVAKKVTDANGNITNPFYVHIDSTRMGFHSVDYNTNGSVKNDVEVVHIGNNSATVQNATFEGSNGTTFNNKANFKQSINLYKPNSTTEGFTLKVEANGSFSIGILN